MKRVVEFALAAVGALTVVPASSLRADEPSNATDAPRDAIVERFTKPLGDEWRWLREHREAWRLGKGGLEVLIEPGNMWGPANDAKNVLVRSIPAAWRHGAELSAVVEHRPKNRWEQLDLVWYFSDSAMVKLGLEIENDVTNVVMGREDDDKTQTIAVIPYKGESVELRLVVDGDEIAGSYRRPKTKKWTAAGKCSLPKAAKTMEPLASLQFYQGVEGSNRWGRVQELRLAPLSR